MKLAAVKALAELTKSAVPDIVTLAYNEKNISFGPDYIIPAPFDPRLMEIVPAAVAQAAMDSGVATRPILDMADYRNSLRARMNPTISSGVVGVSRISTVASTASHVGPGAS